MKNTTNLLLFILVIYPWFICESQTIIYENKEIKIHVMVENLYEDSVLIKYKIKNNGFKPIYIPILPYRVFQPSRSDSTIYFRFGVDLNGYGDIDLVKIPINAEFEGSIKAKIVKDKIKYRRLLINYIYEGPDIRCINNSCVVDIQFYASNHEWVNVYFND